MSEPSAVAEILSCYARRFDRSPGRARLAHLARSVKRIPEQLMADVAALVLEVGDVELVGDDIHVHLIEVGFCDARYANATAFLKALGKRLQSYVSDPEEAAAARADLRERVAWWRMAVGAVPVADDQIDGAFYGCREDGAP